MPQTTSEILHELNIAAKSGAISKSSTDELNKFSSSLCHSQAYTEFGEREFPQVCETVRLHLLRSHVETLQNHVAGLHDHITNLNKQNSKTQYCVIALTVVAIIFGAIQTGLSFLAEKRAERQYMQIETKPQMPAIKPESPIPLKHPSSYQATPVKEEVIPSQAPHENK